LSETDDNSIFACGGGGGGGGLPLHLPISRNLTFDATRKRQII